MRVRTYVAALLALAVGSPALAQGARLKPGAGSRVVIQGTSNMHKWDCVSTSFTGTAEVPSGTPAEVGKAVTSLAVTIPARSIDCGNGTMNNNLRKAMKAEQHPNVTFRLTSYDAAPAGASGAYNATVTGSLTIAGTERPVELKATVSPDGKGGARAEGSTEIRTTDYGVPIVRALMGTLKTGERITVVLTIVATR
ncbi:MAG: YceI family protein [Gemmatimonadaceae bacterium]